MNSSINVFFVSIYTLLLITIIRIDAGQLYMIFISILFIEPAIADLSIGDSSLFPSTYSILQLFHIRIDAGQLLTF